MIQSLSLKFKGDRTYLHGTDMFDESMKALEGWNQWQQVTLAIHRMTDQPLGLVPVSEFQRGSIQQVAQISGKYHAGNLATWVLIENNGAVKDRYPYPEQQMVDAADIQTETIVLSSWLSFSRIEHIVALNKGLLQHLFPEAPGKWVFTKVKIKDLPALRQAEGIAIRFRKRIGFQLTDSQLYVPTHSTPIGSIHFSTI